MFIVITTIFILCLIGAWAHDAWLRRQIGRRYPAIGTFFDHPRGRLHVIEAGKASATARGPAIVLIHGASGSARDMLSAFAPHLSHYAWLHAIDRPGIGYSRNSVPDARLSSPEVQADIINDYIVARGLERPVIIGHSWGGSVAQCYAQKYGSEAAGVISLCPPLYPWEGRGSWYEYVTTTRILGPLISHTLLTKYGRTQIQAGIERNFYPEVAPEHFAETIGAALILQPAPFRTNAIYGLALSTHLARLSADYQMPSCPFILASGDHDHTVSFKRNSLRYHQAFPDSELMVFKGAGHMIHHTHTSDIVQRVQQLIERGPKK